MTYLASAFVILTATSVQPTGKPSSVDTFSFAKADQGKLPKGWKAMQTNKGDGASVWKVVADDKTPSKTGFALAQTAAGPKQVFSLCVLEDSKYKNVEVNVNFKAIDGKVDQGGGIVWRYQNENNYYVARFNPLEDNYRVYKVIDGKRLQLETTVDQVVVNAGEWHKLTVRHDGDQIECFLDGKKWLSTKDNAIAGAGKVGLWTKADAQTRFDGLTIQELPQLKKKIVADLCAYGSLAMLSTAYPHGFATHYGRFHGLAKCAKSQF